MLNELQDFKINYQKTKEKEKAAKIRFLKNKYSFVNTPESSQKKSKKRNRKWVKKSVFTRRQRRKNKEKVNVVFNYCSTFTLTEAMTKLLNRGLNFTQIEYFPNSCRLG